MHGQPGLQTSSPAYAIHAGDLLQALCWSNTAANIDGWFRAVYDDGTTDTFRFDRFTLSSARAASGESSGHVARRNGYVTEGLLFGDAAQRGQTYAIVYIAQGPSPSDVRMVLCRGYIYASVPLSLGVFVEPGPAGGHGAINVLTLTQPAAGVDYASSSIPTGAIRRPVGFHGQLVAAVAAANRELVIKIQNSTPTDLAGCVASEIQTSGQTQDYYGTFGITSTGNSAGIGAGAIQIGLPKEIPTFADRFAFVTFNIQAADQWGTGLFVVEEWVMPN